MLVLPAHTPGSGEGKTRVVLPAFSPRPACFGNRFRLHVLPLLIAIGFHICPVAFFIFDFFFPVVCALYPCFFLIFPFVCAAYALLEPTTEAKGRAPATLNAAIMAKMKSFFTVISHVEVHGLMLTDWT